MGQNVLPPLLLVEFLEVDHDGLLILYGGGKICRRSNITSLTQCPSAILDFYLLAELAVQDLVFPFDPKAELLLCNDD